MRSLFHDKSFAENPMLGPEPEEVEHYLPSETISNAQKSQEASEVMELFTKINPYKETRKVQVNMTEEGLGPLPDYIPTVGAVLLFNSGENPYQQVVTYLIYYSYESYLLL